MLSKAINSWFDGYRKMFCYKGRSTRSEFGFFILIQIIILWLSFALLFSMDKILPDAILGICVMLIFIVTFLTMLSYNIRRLHDIGTSGLWCFVYLLCPGAIIGASLIIKPTSGDNQYGSNPRILSK
ncbi:DUF805 domain-containing protein [Gilliamella sp. Pra-s65]|uniref:DUF805 domain-containing protein n=1 Tax=unclassified Gilliamella TaxID=2685620 RepID=UPI001365CB55|nr:DUF805 domain-containing protein [Gilliamella sp. Pra-s65]MWP72877.1 DUF805 domain-containing protein [Gilliamella sp. Pra-s52]